MFLPILRVKLSREKAKSRKLFAKRANLKAFAGHIWPTGRMLFMLDLGYIIFEQVFQSGIGTQLFFNVNDKFAKLMYKLNRCREVLKLPEKSQGCK